MLDSTVVVDAVVHPYNLGPDNPAEAATAQLEAVYAAHRLTSGERYNPRR